MATLLLRRRSGCFLDAALQAARRVASSCASAVDVPLPLAAPPPLAARRVASSCASAVDVPPPLTPPPPPPPRPPYIAPFAPAGSFPTSHGVAAMGRSIATPGLWYLRSSGAGAWRHHSSGPSQPQGRPQAKEDKTSAQYPQEGKKANPWAHAKKSKLSEQYAQAQAKKAKLSAGEQRPSEPQCRPQPKNKDKPLVQYPQEGKKAKPWAQTKKLKLSQQYPQAQAKKAKLSAGEQQNNKNMKKWRRRTGKKKLKARPQPLRRTPVWRPALYGPKLDLPAPPPQEWKLELAAKAIDCFGEADMYPKFDSVTFLKRNPLLTFRGVPGSVGDDTVPIIPDDKKDLIRSLPKLLYMLHKSGYCIKEDFTLGDLVISGQFKFLLRGHLTLVPCTPKRMNRNYSRAAKITMDMFQVSCGESALSLIPMEMKSYLKVLESGGHRCIYLILTHVALLPMSSRSTVLRKFHDEILEVLPREGLEDIKDKILSKIDITDWDTIAEENKPWYRYRAKEGNPYDPKKPSHFLSLQRNVVAHKNMKTLFGEGVIDLVLYGCYPVQLCQMQQALWKHKRLGHLYVEEDFNDGCAHLTASMARSAPSNV